jgi:hypothetical protein
MQVFGKPYFDEISMRALMGAFEKPHLDEISTRSLMGGHEKTPFQRNFHKILDRSHPKNRVLMKFQHNPRLRLSENPISN